MNRPRHTGLTFRFSTFQELVDRVPADRIRVCLEELGVFLGASKAYAELLHGAAGDIERKGGVTVREGLPQQVLTVPSEFKWIDDGKGDLEGSMMLDGTGFELAKIKMQLGEKVKE